MGILKDWRDDDIEWGSTGYCIGAWSDTVHSVDEKIGTLGSRCCQTAKKTTERRAKAASEVRASTYPPGGGAL